MCFRDLPPALSPVWFYERTEKPQSAMQLPQPPARAAPLGTHVQIQYYHLSLRRVHEVTVSAHCALQGKEAQCLPGMAMT